MIATLHDGSDDPSFPHLSLPVTVVNNRLEIVLPDNQIISIEQFLGSVQLLHYSGDTLNDEPVIVPLMTVPPYVDENPNS